MSRPVRDLVRTPGLIATFVYSGLVYAALRAANALVWNPVLEAAGMPLGSWGVLTAAVTLLGAFTAWRAHAWIERAGSIRVAFGIAASLFAMYALLALSPAALTLPTLVSQGFALGVAPVLLVDLLNRRIHASERRATLLSFESLFQRGVYGVIAYGASSAIDASSFPLVLLGVALLAAIPLALTNRLRE